VGGTRALRVDLRRPAPGPGPGGASLPLGRRREYRRAHDLYFQRSWPEKWIGAPERDGLRFRLDQDPGELREEAGAPMPEPLRESITRASEARSVDPDPEVREALEALGYLEGEPAAE